MSSTPETVSAAALVEHGAFVRALAKSLIADPHEAEDLAQETWVRALEHPPEEGTRARRWLARVTRNVAINRRRAAFHRAGREEAAARPETLPSTADYVAQQETLRRLVDAVLALDEPYRRTVLARFFRNEDVAAIAAREETSPATVRSRVQRALARLRERLDREHDGSRGAWCTALAGLTGGGSTTVALQGASFALALGLVGTALLGIGAWLWKARGASEIAAIDEGVAAAITLPPALTEAGPEVLVPPAPETSVRSSLSAVPRTIEVRVRASDIPYPPLSLAGGPAPGARARVRLTEHESAYAGALRSGIEVVMDEQGVATCSLPDPGQRPLWVHASIAGDEVWRTRFESAELDEATTTVELTVRRAARGVLRGIVVDTEDRPIEGVRVAVALGSLAAQAVSDDRGAFELVGLVQVRSIQALAPGYSLLEWNLPESLDEGGWSSLRMTMAPSARLGVRIVDQHGTVVPELSATLSLGPGEQSGNDDWRWSSAATQNASSDEAGRLVFDDAWAERNLLLTLTGLDDRAVADAMDRGELVLDGGPGAALRVARGTELELDAIVCMLRIAGAVLRADGTPVQDAHVSLYDLDRLRSSSRALATATSGPDGRFSMLVRTSRAPGGLVLVGREPVGERASTLRSLQGLGYAGGPSTPTECLGASRVEVPVSDAWGDGADVALVLQPTFDITGGLVDENGAPVAHLFGHMNGYQINAVPTGARDPSAPTSLEERAEVTYQDAGRFLVGCLPAGAYDLIVTRDRSYERFSGIAAGSHDVSLTLAPEGEVRVRLRTDAVAELADAMIVLHGTAYTRDVDGGRSERARDSMAVSDVAGWPHDAPWSFEGVAGDGAGNGGLDAIRIYSAREASEHRLPPLHEGWYVFGVEPSKGKERNYMPVATPLLWYGAGDYTIDFQLTRTAKIEGRVDAPGRDELLALSLVDDDGSAIPVSLRGALKAPIRIVVLPASGRFALADVPVGRRRLRVGTRAELAAGAFQREVAVEVRAEGNPPLEITL